MRKIVGASAAIVLAAIVAMPQATAGQGRGGRGGTPVPQFASPEVGADRKVTFRIYAPQADAVRLAAGDIPGVGQNAQLTRADNGVWQLTPGPIEPGFPSLQLQYRWGGDDRPTPSLDQRVQLRRAFE